MLGSLHLVTSSARPDSLGVVHLSQVHQQSGSDELYETDEKSPSLVPLGEMSGIPSLNACVSRTDH